MNKQRKKALGAKWAPIIGRATRALNHIGNLELLLRRTVMDFNGALHQLEQLSTVRDEAQEAIAAIHKFFAPKKKKRKKRK